ncbi:MAG: hypothetical protein JKY60_04305 [Kordiimonadaceae bacterium]|nr:hypothetical protein [Kordiimonadaceae bacterium]
MARKSRNILIAKIALAASLLLGSNAATHADELKITDDTFKCLAEMTKVKHFFVDNLLGDLEATLAAVNAPDGAVYPVGSVVQLVPTEVMIKRHKGWQPRTNDWEFFELNVSKTGSSIKVRGADEVFNRFGGNCFECHKLAEPKYDLICEMEHGCDPLPFTREQIAAVQQQDPRCDGMKE